MTDLNISEYLASKGYRGRQAAGAEMAFPCFFDCQEPADSRKRKLYINLEEGFYDCKVCGAHGGTYLLQKHFGDSPEETHLVADNSQARRDILNEAAAAGAAMLLQNDDTLMYLIERGLEPETILERRLGVVTGGWSLISSLAKEHKKEDLNSTGLVFRDGPRAGRDFFWDHILIPYQSRGQVVMIRGRARSDDAKGGKYLTGPDQANRIYNVDDLADADDVIICEGEFDCLMLKQILAKCPELKWRNVAVIGLPGTQALPDNFESYFTHVKRVFIGFDGDEAGRKGAEKIKEKLGVKARILQFPHDVLERARDAGKTDKDFDWSTLIHHFGLTWQHVAQMIATSSGKRVFSMAEAGLTYRQVSNDRAVIKTGLMQIDSVIGGFKYGQVVIILAKTGAGKTQLLCNLAYYMRTNKVLYVTLEMTREEIYERLSKIYRFWNPEASDETLEYALSNIYICDENRLDEKGLEQVVDEFELESGVRPDIVMVDYLGYYARGAKGSTPYEKNGNAVMQLKAEAKGGSSLDPRKRFLVICPAQVNRGATEGKPISLDDARDAGTIEETADFLISLYRPDDALAVTDISGNVRSSGKVKMEFLKARGPGKGRTITLQGDALTMAMVEDNTPAAAKARQHTESAQRGMSYNELRKQELAPIQMKMKGM